MIMAIDDTTPGAEILDSYLVKCIVMGLTRDRRCQLFCEYMTEMEHQYADERTSVKRRIAESAGLTEDEFSVLLLEGHACRWESHCDGHHPNGLLRIAQLFEFAQLNQEAGFAGPARPKSSPVGSSPSPRKSS